MTEALRKRLALLAARSSFVVALVATLLGTVSYLHGNMALYAVNCVILVTAAVLILVNYRIAGVI